MLGQLARRTAAAGSGVKGELLMPSPFSILSAGGCAGALASAVAFAAAPPEPTDAGHRRGPPPEAFAACKDLDEGDTCQVTFHEHTIDGTCEPFGEELACKPS